MAISRQERQAQAASSRAQESSINTYATIEATQSSVPRHQGLFDSPIATTETVPARAITTPGSANSVLSATPTTTRPHLSRGGNSSAVLQHNRLLPLEETEETPTPANRSIGDMAMEEWDRTPFSHISPTQRDPAADTSAIRIQDQESESPEFVSPTQRPRDGRSGLLFDSGASPGAVSQQENSVPSAFSALSPPAKKKKAGVVFALANETQSDNTQLSMTQESEMEWSDSGDVVLAKDSEPGLIEETQQSAEQGRRESFELRPAKIAETQFSIQATNFDNGESQEDRSESAKTEYPVSLARSTGEADPALQLPSVIANKRAEGSSQRYSDVALYAQTRDDVSDGDNGQSSVINTPDTIDMGVFSSVRSERSPSFVTPRAKPPQAGLAEDPIETPESAPGSSLRSSRVARRSPQERVGIEDIPMRRRSFQPLITKDSTGSITRAPPKQRKTGKGKRQESWIDRKLASAKTLLEDSQVSVNSSGGEPTRMTSLSSFQSRMSKLMKAPKQNSQSSQDTTMVEEKEPQSAADSTHNDEVADMQSTPQRNLSPGQPADPDANDDDDDDDDDEPYAAPENASLKSDSPDNDNDDDESAAEELKPSFEAITIRKPTRNKARKKRVLLKKGQPSSSADGLNPTVDALDDMITALDSPEASLRKPSGRRRGHPSNGYDPVTDSHQVQAMGPAGGVVPPLTAPPLSVLRMSQNRLSKIIKLRPQAAPSIMSPGIRPPKLGLELQTPTRRGPASLAMTPSAGISLGSIARKRHADVPIGELSAAVMDTPSRNALRTPASASRRMVNTSNDSVRQLKRAYKKSNSRRLTMRLLRYGLSTELAGRSSEVKKQDAELQQGTKQQHSNESHQIETSQMPRSAPDSAPVEMYVWAMLNEIVTGGKRKRSILPGNYYMARVFLEDMQAGEDPETVMVAFKHSPGVRVEVDPSTLVEFSLAPTDLVLARRVKSRYLEPATVLSVSPRGSAVPNRATVRFSADNLEQTVLAEEIALHTSMVVDDALPEGEAVPTVNFWMEDAEIPEDDFAPSKLRKGLASTASVRSSKQKSVDVDASGSLPVPNTEKDQSVKRKRPPPKKTNVAWVGHEPPVSTGEQSDTPLQIFDGLSFMITVSEPGAGSSASQDGGVQSRRSTPNYPDVDPARGRSKHSWTKASKAQTMLMSEPLSAKSAVVMDRARLAEWITQRGGTVVASHKKCIEMFDDQKRLEDAGVESNPPNMFLIADKASTTAKYLAALALGIPRVSGVWISECVMNQRLEDHRPFQLSNGWSEELGAMCASTFVEEFLYGTTVMVSGSAQFQNNWCQLLALAGAKTITPPAVLGSRTSSKTPQIVCDFILSDKKPRNGNDSKMAKMCTRNRRLSQQQWNTLAVESGSPLKDYGVDDGISTVLAKSSEDSIGAEANDHELAGDADGSADPWLVSHRWARQCLINQRVLRFNGHPSYVEYS